MDNTQERRRERSRNWKRHNPEKVKAAYDHYRRTHMEYFREKSRKYRAAHPDKTRLYAQRSYAKAEKRLVVASRARARRLGIEHTITPTDLLPLPDQCPVLGIALRYGGGTQSDASASLDRINNSKGYVRGNVRVISFRANRIKNDGTIEELQRIVAYMLEGQ